MSVTQFRKGKGSLVYLLGAVLLYSSGGRAEGQPEPDKLSPADLAIEHAKVQVKMSSALWELECSMTAGKPFYQRMVLQPSASSISGVIDLYDDSGCSHHLFSIPFSYSYKLGQEIPVGDDEYAFEISLTLTSQPIPVGLDSSMQTIYVGKDSLSLGSVVYTKK